MPPWSVPIVSTVVQGERKEEIQTKLAKTARDGPGKKLDKMLDVDLRFRPSTVYQKWTVAFYMTARRSVRKGQWKGCF